MPNHGRISCVQAVILALAWLRTTNALYAACRNYLWSLAYNSPGLHTVVPTFVRNTFHRIFVQLLSVSSIVIPIIHRTNKNNN
jgi:hypothetical protein